MESATGILSSLFASAIQTDRRSDKITPTRKDKNSLSYFAIWKRLNKLNLKINPRLGKDTVIAIDSTRVKAADRGGSG